MLPAAIHGEQGTVLVLGDAFGYTTGEAASIERHGGVHISCAYEDDAHVMNILHCEHAYLETHTGGRASSRTFCNGSITITIACMTGSNEHAMSLCAAG